MAKHKNDSARKSTLMARRRQYDNMSESSKSAMKRPGSNKK